MKALVLILIIIFSSQVLATSTRSIQADQIISADKTKTFSLPSATDTLVGRDSSDTLTNKVFLKVLQEKSATYTILVTDDIVLGDSSGGTFTFTLPTAVGNSGKTLTVKKDDSSLTIVTIDGSGIETVGGSLTTTLDTEGETVDLISDGSNWLIVKRTIPSIWTAYTPTGGFTNTTYIGFWKRVGDSAMFQVRGDLTGTPGAAALTVNLPSGMTMDAAKLVGTPDSATTMPSGVVTAADVGTNRYVGGVRYSSASSVAFSNDGNINAWTQAIPFTWVSGDVFSATFAAPISGWN